MPRFIVEVFHGSSSESGSPFSQALDSATAKDAALSAVAYYRQKSGIQPDWADVYAEGMRGEKGTRGAKSGDCLHRWTVE